LEKNGALLTEPHACALGHAFAPSSIEFGKANTNATSASGSWVIINAARSIQSKNLAPTGAHRSNAPW
jgi:hypothetical protein